MESDIDSQMILQCCSHGGNEEEEVKPKVAVIMGPTASGKSKLAIDLAAHFPIEIINADSMQVYHSLDVLTNKVPFHEQKGVPHHLLGTVSPTVEFTAKDFRDSAIPIINDILSRNCLPVIVRGTNYYIQALVSPFLLDDVAENLDESFLNQHPGDEQSDRVLDFERNVFNDHDYLKEIDTVAADRVHPHDSRKAENHLLALEICGSVVNLTVFISVCFIELLDQVYGLKVLDLPNFGFLIFIVGLAFLGHTYSFVSLQISSGLYMQTNLYAMKEKIVGMLWINQYLKLYARTGILPSKLYQGKGAENWGRIDNCRFDCCFICIDAAIPVLDQYVGQRVDSMIDAGLLSEVYDIYNPQADYTRGLRQAIGVREFEDFLRVYLLKSRDDEASDSNYATLFMASANKDKILKDNMREILHSPDNNELKVILTEAIDKVKLNMRRLVRRQKRRLTRLQTLFGWNIQHVDATESISCKSDELWATQVVGRAVEIINTFLSGYSSTAPDLMVCDRAGKKPIERNLWTQYVCKACGDRVLRGAHEWEQHKQGRSHRKLISRIQKSQSSVTKLPAHRSQMSKNDLSLSELS